MAETSNYKFTIFGDSTDPIYDEIKEQENWNILDLLLGSLIRLFGDGGTIQGFIPTVVEGKTLVFTWGEALVDLCYGTIPGDHANLRVDLTEYEAGDDIILYLSHTSDTRTSGLLKIEHGPYSVIPERSIGLARVIIPESGTIDIATSVHYEDDVYTRPMVGLTTSIEDLVRSHHHTGVGKMPTKVHLGPENPEVKGKLSMEYIDGDIPADRVKGTIPIENLTISHQQLNDIGKYTHQQLDTLIEASVADAFQRYGTVGVINRMRLTLQLLRLNKEGFDNILGISIVDRILRRLVNERPFIANITPLEWIDVKRTTEDNGGFDPVPYDSVNERFKGKKAVVNPNLNTIISFWDGNTDDLAANPVRYGLNGPTKQLAQNVTVVLRSTSDGYIELATTRERIIYAPDGHFYVRVDAGSPSTWGTLEWHVEPSTVNGDGASDPRFKMSVAHSNKTTVPLPNEGWVEVTHTDNTDAVSIAADDGKLYNYLYIDGYFERGGLDTDTNFTTPLLTFLEVTYTPSATSIYNHVTIDEYDEWYRFLEKIDGAYNKDPNVLIRENDCGDTDVTLDDAVRYTSVGSLLSPIVDGGEAGSRETVYWDRLFTCYKKPVGTDIAVYIRNNADGVWADDTEGWVNITPMTEAVDLSAYRARFIQAKWELLSAEDNTFYTPEVLGMTFAFSVQSDPDPFGSFPQYHMFQFAEDNDGPYGWRFNELSTDPNTKAVLDNIDHTTFKGGITIDDDTNVLEVDTDANAVIASKWTSPILHIPQSNFSRWNKVCLYGENLHKCRVDIEFSSDGLVWTEREKHYTIEQAENQHDKSKTIWVIDLFASNQNIYPYDPGKLPPASMYSDQFYCSGEQPPAATSSPFLMLSTAEGLKRAELGEPQSLTWQTVLVGTTAFDSPDGGRTIYAVRGTDVFHSADFGLSWRNLPADPSVTNWDGTPYVWTSSFRAVHFSTPTEGWLLNDGNQLFHTVTAGLNTAATPAWSVYGTYCNEWSMADMDFYKDATATYPVGWAVGRGGNAAPTVGYLLKFSMHVPSNTWVRTVATSPVVATNGTAQLKRVLMANASTNYAVGDFGQVLYTANPSLSSAWTNIASPVPSTGYVHYTDVKMTPTLNEVRVAGYMDDTVVGTTTNTVNVATSGWLSPTNTYAANPSYINKLTAFSPLPSYTYVGGQKVGTIANPQYIGVEEVIDGVPTYTSTSIPLSYPGGNKHVVTNLFYYNTGLSNAGVSTLNNNKYMRLIINMSTEEMSISI
jgi:hypothetical protein